MNGHNLSITPQPVEKILYITGEAAIIEAEQSYRYEEKICYIPSVIG
jgi:hypothetical protein